MTEALDPIRHSGTDLVQVECPARRPAAGSDDAGAPLDGVALVTLNRPRALNALSFALLTDLGRVIEALDADPAEVREQREAQGVERARAVQRHERDPVERRAGVVGSGRRPARRTFDLDQVG